jgi:hypothetical protein
MNEFYSPRSMKKAFCCRKGKNAFLAAAQHLGDSFSPSSNASICSVFSLEEEAFMQLLGHQEKEGEELS